MKKSLIMLGTLAGLALVGGATVGLLASKANTIETHASNGDYKIAGSFTTWGSSPEEMTDAGDGIYTYTKTFARGDLFKVVDNGVNNWYGYNGEIGGTGSSFFAAENGNNDDNIYCRISGNYTIQFDSTDKTYSIIDNASTDTYSYILTSWSNYNCAYLFNSDSDKYSEWSSTPAMGDVGGGYGYNIKLTYGGNDYYGFYKIADRYLNDFTTLIMKGDGNVSGKYDNQSDDFTINGTTKVYACVNEKSPTTANSSSAVYRASEFLYDLANARASHTSTINSLTYNYSFCGISASEASTLLSTYNTLKEDTDVSAIFDASSFSTYDHDNEEVTSDTIESKRANYSIGEIMEVVAEIASGANTNDVSPAVNANSHSANIALTAISSVGLVTAGGFFFIRKKRLL